MLLWNFFPYVLPWKLPSESRYKVPDPAKKFTDSARSPVRYLTGSQFQALDERYWKALENGTVAPVINFQDALLNIFPAVKVHYLNRFSYLASEFPIRQCCGSGMFIPDPDFYPSRIRSKSSNKREGLEEICCHIFFCRHNNHKIDNYFIFELVQKKNLGQFTKNNFLPQKLLTSSQKYCFGIRDPEKPIPDLVSKRHRIRNSAPLIIFPAIKVHKLNR